MRLYTFPGAPNPRRVHFYLHEKRIEIPCETVDILTRANRASEFTDQVDAMGRLPVLELDDGSHLAESVAICRYFEALHPEPPLFGSTAKEQGTIEMWIRRMELDFMVPVGLVWIHGSPLTASVMKEQIPAVAAQNRERVGRYFDFLDAHLRDHAFLAGEAFSMADIVGFCTLEFATGLNRFEPPTALEGLGRWSAAMAARPSAEATKPRART